MRKGFYTLPSGRAFLFVVMGLFWVTLAPAQSLQEENKKLEKETNKLLRSAEDNLADNDFSEAEASYRKAVSKSPENVTAKYNMANMYYSKEKASQAASRLLQAAKIAETKEEKHKIFHNLGNSFMEQKDYKNAVEAYKNALRNNPKDEETRYNYALAKKMLEENPESGGGGEDEQDQDQDQTDKEDSDEGEQEPEEGEGENEDQGGDPDENSQEQPKDQDENGEPDKQPGEGEPQPQQPKPGQLSPEQIKSLLEAMNNEEKKVQDKINAERAKGARTRNEKDW
ncbi:MAG TPA: tetratricopeptide repeat protein [Gillisia sp.]|nr:tetratricopeptide repeat protein [Gillisia sp.]